MLTTVLLAATLSAAHAEEPAEEFLLGDVGVRIDLDGSWEMSRWSDWDFKADKKDHSAMLVAWATPTQVDLDASQLDAWSGVMVDKAKELGAKEATVDGKRMGNKGAGPAAEIDVSFSTADGMAGVLHSYSVGVEGQTFHIATVGAKGRDKAVEAALEQVATKLDVRKKPAPPQGGPLSIDGMTTEVPEGWRVPLTNELPEVQKVARDLGLDQLAGCAVAMRAAAADSPEVVVTCAKPMNLGMVDTLNFAAKDPEIRKKLFAGAADDIAPGRAVALADGHTGLVYQLKSGADKNLWVGIVPFGAGITETWAYGHGDSAALEKAVDATLAKGSWVGEHPVALGEIASYYVRYKPFSPIVLGPTLGLLSFLGLAVFLGTRSRRHHDHDHDHDHDHEG